MAKRLTDEAIIAALISEGSIKAASLKLNCTVRTLYSRMKVPEFQTLYGMAKNDLIRGATTRLQGHLKDAIETLAKLMKDTDTAAQTRANCAVNILQYAGRFTEITDFADRLEALEKANAENGL